MSCLKIVFLVCAVLAVFSSTASAQTGLQAVVQQVIAPINMTCRWVGTAPFCQQGCEAGENETEKSACGDAACCWSGWKYRCCKPIIPAIVPSKTKK